MSRKHRNQRPSRRFTRAGGPPPQPGGKEIPKPDPIFASLWLLGQRLRKYWDDILAWLLLAFALITLLGIFNLSSGVFLNVWAAFLRTWFGWGAFVVPLTLGWIGGAILLHNFGWTVRVKWGRVIAAEGAAFALLGLLNIFNGGSVALAVGGRGGGLVGWGLGLMVTRLLPPPADALVFGMLCFVCLLFALDVTGRRFAQLRAWLQLQGLEAHTPEARLLDESAGAGPASTPATTRDLQPPERKPKPRLSSGERLRVPVEAAVDDKPRPKRRDKRLPSLELLDDSDLRRPAQREIDETASIIVKTLKEFGVPVAVVGAKVGPSVTQYQVEPGFVEKPGPDGVSKSWKVRVSQISALADDLALALSASTLRIEAPVPGQSYIGIEVPHRRTSLVSLRPVMESEGFQRVNAPLAIALGRDVSGASVSADLGAMPHLLIAGTTGSGKSVCITSVVACLACNNTPDDLRMVLIDPKMVELVRFNGLPHLYGKVETELDRILGVLRWVVKEMDRRYKEFERVAARNLDAFNAKMAKKKDADRLPRIVVIVDELADLMMQAPDETERTVVRLAQMARATGIHLIVATQRPSTNIVTGLIKANFPARISFAVASGIDSRVILDTPGAETLLGRGDMLFLAPEVGAPVRLQGCFVADKEVDRIVSYWREQMADDEPEEDVVEAMAEDDQNIKLKPGQAPWDVMLAREAVVDDKDAQIEQAIAIVKKYGTASASLLQRKMRIGYPRAARLMDELKDMGIVGREQAGGKTREVFIQEDDDPIGERAARLMEDEEEEG
ncbi:MAG TPA: DNA translocase FtsK [Anaerolineales bacterium]|nr:DNA translocase FtsK [Anaerolineales bacterium]